MTDPKPATPDDGAHSTAMSKDGDAALPPPRDDYGPSEEAQDAHSAMKDEHPKLRPEDEAAPEDDNGSDGDSAE